MHPAEASHGDLGMITADDVVIAISYSGESDEIGRILPLIKRRGAKVIAITGRAESTLAREADVHLDAARREGGLPARARAHREHHRHARARRRARRWRCSTRAASRATTSRSTIPGGALGRRLLVHVSDIMRKGEQLPRNRPDDPLLPDGARRDVEEGHRHDLRGRRRRPAPRASSPTATCAARSRSTTASRA